VRLRHRFPPIPKLALGAFVLYLVGSALLGEAYPFSRYSMYAQHGYQDGAHLVIRLDGVELQTMRGIVDIDGVDPETLRYPQGTPAGVAGYPLDHLRHYIAQHGRRPGTATGEAQLEIGARFLRVGPSGIRVTQAFVPIAAGTARRP